MRQETRQTVGKEKERKTTQTDKIEKTHIDIDHTHTDIHVDHTQAEQVTPPSVFMFQTSSFLSPQFSRLLVTFHFLL